MKAINVYLQRSRNNTFYGEKNMLLKCFMHSIYGVIKIPEKVSVYTLTEEYICTFREGVIFYLKRNEIWTYL